MYLAEGTPAAGTADFGSMILQLWPIALMLLVLYFLLLRPQKKRQKERGEMLNALNKGDKIVTIGGLHGTIMELTDDTVVIRVNDATKMTFDRAAISSVTKSASAGTSEDEKK